MTFRIAPHTLSFFFSTFIFQFPLFLNFHTFQAFVDCVGLACMLVISSPICLYVFVALASPKNSCCSPLHPPILHEHEGPENACDNPHAVSLQLGEKHFYFPMVITILKLAKITQAFAISHFKAELSVASQAVFRLGK